MGSGDYNHHSRDKMSPNGSKLPGSCPNSKRASPKCPKKIAHEIGSSSPIVKNTPKSGSPFKQPKKDKRGPGLDFNEYTHLSQRLTKSMYYAKKMPCVSRPSFPLTVLAVNAFTSTKLGTKLDTLEFLDLELASQVGINACVSPTTLIMTLVYLERLHSHNPAYLETIKPSELFVISLLVASKFIQDDGEDCGIYNDEWAASAGMETKDVNKLEIEFLTAIDWNVNVSREEFDKALQNLECRLAQQEGEKRGSFTYTELEKLSQAILTWNLIWPIVYDYAIKVIVAASITYATLITTVLTSSLMAPNMVQFLSRSLTAQTLEALAPSPPGCLYDRMPTLDNNNIVGEEGQMPDLVNTTETELLFNNFTTIPAFIFSNRKTVFNLESHKCTTCSKSDKLLKDDGIVWTSFNAELQNLIQFNYQPTKLSFFENRFKFQNRFRALYNSCSASALRYNPEQLGALSQFISL
jgi:hypothetical protein